MACASSTEFDWAVAGGAIPAPISMMADRAPTNANSVLFTVVALECLRAAGVFVGAMVTAAFEPLMGRNLPVRSQHSELAELSQRVRPLRVIRD